MKNKEEEPSTHQIRWLILLIVALLILMMFINIRSSLIGWKSFFNFRPVTSEEVKEYHREKEEDKARKRERILKKVDAYNKKWEDRAKEKERSKQEKKNKKK